MERKKSNAYENMVHTRTQTQKAIKHGTKADDRDSALHQNQISQEDLIVPCLHSQAERRPLSDLLARIGPSVWELQRQMKKIKTKVVFCI